MVHSSNPNAPPAGESVVTDEEQSIDVGQYCREVEAYLCRKNGGHLIRVVGPSFALVSGWARAGVPIRIVQRGIDRRHERHVTSTMARRPLRIEFCDADVLTSFDEWRRAVGVGLHAGRPSHEEPSNDDASVASASDSRRSPSLPRHLRRVIDKLSRVPEQSQRPRGLDPWIAATVTELGQMERDAANLRGAERARVLARLRELDGEMLAVARASASAQVLAEAARAAEEELRPFCARMNRDALGEATEQATGRHVREALRLPVLDLG